jgi:hypothetical protein
VTEKNSTKSPTARLVERQRRLWGHAEAIELAQKHGTALSVDVSEWLHRALKNIACGQDANEVFDVVPEKQGVRKDGLLSEIRQKITNGYLAAATDKTSSQKKKTAVALDEISSAMPAVKKTTVRKNWNKASADRKTTFTFGKK